MEENQRDVQTKQEILEHHHMTDKELAVIKATMAKQEQLHDLKEVVKEEISSHVEKQIRILTRRMVICLTFPVLLLGIISILLQVAILVRSATPPPPPPVPYEEPMEEPGAPHPPLPRGEGPGEVAPAPHHALAPKTSK